MGAVDVMSHNCHNCSKWAKFYKAYTFYSIVCSHRSKGIIWELYRNAETQAPFQTYWMRIFIVIKAWGNLYAAIKLVYTNICKCGISGDRACILLHWFHDVMCFFSPLLKIVFSNDHTVKWTYFCCTVLWILTHVQIYELPSQDAIPFNHHKKLSHAVSLQAHSAPNPESLVITDVFSVTF